MSKLAVLLLLVLTAFLGLFLSSEARSTDQTSASPEHDRAAITKILDEQQTTWNSGDVISFMKGYWNSPELTFAGSGGIARGWESVLARYKREYPDQAAMGQVNFSNVEVRFLGPDAALVLGQWHLRRSSGDIGGVFSLVFQRLPEGWRIVHDHTSLVKAKAE
ncbi:MAG: nuclear transport factor 2 family protein [Candidatus Acidiferrum sp.]